MPHDCKVGGAVPSPARMKTKPIAVLSLGAAVAAIGSALVHHGHARHSGHHGHSSHQPRHSAVNGNAWRLEFHNPAPLVAGKAAELNLRLWDTAGRRLTFADLAVAHEEKLHLLIVDETLSDYHHVHPVEETPGRFVTSFVPKAGGRYIAFADVTEAKTGTQRYVRAEMQSDGANLVAEHVAKHVAVVDGYRFELALPHGITAGKGAHAVVRVTSPEGKPATNLEPIMGAFAHGVGFSRSLETVLHVHPHGKEPKSSRARTGPELAFHLNPDRAGFHRLYVQVRIDGRDRFAAFGLEVKS